MAAEGHSFIVAEFLVENNENLENFENLGYRTASFKAYLLYPYNPLGSRDMARMETQSMVTTQLSATCRLPNA